MKTFVNYCTNHLYFVEKSNKGYKATCLFCGAEKFYHKNSEMETDYILQNYNSISSEEIEKKHKLHFSYQKVHNIVESILLQESNLSNDDILTKFMIYLYEIDLSTYTIVQRKSTNPLKKMYLEKKKEAITSKIEELMRRLDSSKQKIKHL